MSDNTPVPVGVPQTPSKAQVGAVITAVGALLTALVASLPDNDQVQLWGGLLLGVLTVAGTYYGVYQTPNKAKAPNGARRADEAGVGEGKFILLCAAGVLLALLLFFVVFPALGDDNNNDGRHGNDWELAPIGARA